MTIPGLDPSGELGKLFFQVQSKQGHEKGGHHPRTVSQGASDAVDLSQLAKDIRLQASRAAQLPDIRANRIQEIQRALTQGNELTTSQQLADAMTREVILHALR